MSPAIDVRRGCAQVKLSPSLNRSEATRFLIPKSMSTPHLIREVAFVVGPEGGWAPGEIDQVIVSSSNPASFWRASLGSTILRGETACMYALATWSAFVNANGAELPATASVFSGVSMAANSEPPGPE